MESVIELIDRAWYQTTRDNYLQAMNALSEAGQLCVKTLCDENKIDREQRSQLGQLEALIESSNVQKKYIKLFLNLYYSSKFAQREGTIERKNVMYYSWRLRTFIEENMNMK